MNTPQFETAMTAICKDVIATVADLPGDTPAQKAVRQQAVADTMVSLMPKDPLETMLAGQCLVFDRLVHEAARGLLRGQAEENKLRSRPQICSSAKLFLAQLAQFERRQAREAANAEARPDAATQAEQPAAANPDRRRAPAPQPRTAPNPPLAAAARPSPRNAAPLPTPAAPASAPPTKAEPSPAFAAERELAQILSRLDPVDPGFDNGLSDGWRASRVPAASQDGPRRDPVPPANGGGLPADAASGEIRQAARVKELV